MINIGVSIVTTIMSLLCLIMIIRIKLNTKGSMLFQQFSLVILSGILLIINSVVSLYVQHQYFELLNTLSFILLNWFLIKAWATTYNQIRKQKVTLFLKVLLMFECIVALLNIFDLNMEVIVNVSTYNILNTMVLFFIMILFIRYQTIKSSINSRSVIITLVGFMMALMGVNGLLYPYHLIFLTLFSILLFIFSLNIWDDVKQSSYY